MFKLRCPDCGLGILPDYACFCGKFEVRINKLIPEWALNDSGYKFEISRYNHIAHTDPNFYSGYTDSKPQLRAKIILDILKEHQVKEFVELGPGFGELLKIADIPSLAIEQSQGFLDYLDSQNLSTVLVKGIAEDLPLADNSVSCFVADGVFQSVINREEFLYELGRVCEKDALIIITIAHKWNYPRRPQNGFNIRSFLEFETLKEFLRELGFNCEYKWLSLESNSFLDTGFEDDVYVSEPMSDYLYIIGKNKNYPNDNWN